MASKLKIISLGGLNEIGKNLTVYEYGDDILVVDCGMAKENRERVVEAALHELKTLAEEGPLEAEISDAKLLFQNVYTGIGDSARSLISYHHGRINRCSPGPASTERSLWRP